MGLCDKECCEKCSRFKECGGCESCNGHPFKGYCFFYKLIKEKGYDGYLIFKKELIEKINNLNIEHLHIDDLNLLLGNYINLEYTLENGSKIELLNDALKDKICSGSMHNHCFNDNTRSLIESIDYMDGFDSDEPILMKV